MQKYKYQLLDTPLILLVISLFSIGIIAVFSATHTVGMDNPNYFSKQLILGIAGLAIMIIMAFIPFKLIQRSSYLFYGLSLFLLVVVLFFGSRGFGAERWLAIGPLKLQPSELAKLATIMAVASYLSRTDVNANQAKNLVVSVAFFIVPFLLIAKQPDLGTSLVFIILCLPMLYWAGLNWFYMFIFLTPALTMLLSFSFLAFLIWMIFISSVLIISRRKPIILVAVFLLHIVVGLVTPVLWSQLKPYQKQRILTFANPEADPKGSGYQIIQSKVAIGSGGIWGKGFLEGSQTQLRFLPAQHTDFIFSVIGEEWGFVGVAVIVLLFITLILYLIYLAGMPAL